MTNPGPPPQQPPGCTCGPYTWNGSYWVFVVSPACPVHGDN